MLHDSNSHTDRRFTVLENRLDGLEARFDKAETLAEKRHRDNQNNFDTVFKRLETAEEKRAVMGLQINRIGERLTIVEKKVA